MTRAALRKTSSELNSGAIHLLRALRRVDERSGLTPSRLSALSVLVFGGPRALGRLARDEEVAGPTMTRIVDGLERLGLAARQQHPDNARMILVSATPDGEQVMEGARERRLRVIGAALERLPAEDRARLVGAAPAFARLAVAVRDELSAGGSEDPTGPPVGR